MSHFLELVQAELARYEHPLFSFAARAAASGVEVTITCKSEQPAMPPYRFIVTPREMENRQFPWMFQKQLYDCLHDYVIEMFTDNPQRQD